MRQEAESDFLWLRWRNKNLNTKGIRLLETGITLNNTNRIRLLLKLLH